MSVWTNDKFNQFIVCVTQEKYKALFITLYTHLFKKNDDILVYYLEKSSQNLLNLFSKAQKVDTLELKKSI